MIIQQYQLLCCRSAKDIAFTCYGTHFEGLAVQLRKLGVHCEVFDPETSSDQNFVEYVKSRQSLTVIVCTKSVCERLARYYVDCYVVQYNKAVKLLLLDIF